MFISKKNIVTFFGASTILLSGCMAKDVNYTDQQKRMQRCEQYVDREKEQCLQGDYITIEEYKDDYKEYKKSKKEEADKKQLKLPAKVKPVIKPVEQEDKPEAEDKLYMSVSQLNGA